MDMSNNQIYAPGASDYSSDYIGFSFNGVHSDTLGIKRTSEGSRFNENLLPTIQDKTVQVPGGDGMYLFGSYYTQRQFNVSYAFDALTEGQLAEIRKVFGDKKIHDLIFDEMPYKIYQAKVTGTASIKHIPFAEGDTNRLYKGEGSIQFTAYNPYARCVNKYLKDYRKFRKIVLTESTYEKDVYYVLDNGIYNKSKEAFDASQTYYEDYSNTREWEAASGMLESGEGYDTLVGNEIKLYNPGSKETDFILTFEFSNGGIPAGTIFLDADSQLIIEEIPKQGSDTHIKINTRLNLIEGYVNGKKSGNIYNKHITSGTFFKIPPSKELTMTIDESAFLNRYCQGIQYDYIYL